MTSKGRSRSGKPGFGEPCFTVPAGELFVDGVLPGVAELAALPTLVPDGPGPPVYLPADEPMKRIEHRRVRCLASYWHAGWEHAVPATLLRVEAARRLGWAADSLPLRWGLAVFDAWRPLELQQELYDTAYADPAIEPGFLAPISDDPTMPAPHSTGGAVDVALTYDGYVLAAGTGFDDVTFRARTAWTEDKPGVDRELRRLLYWSMRTAGFVVYVNEWWHFEFATSRWAQVTGNSPRYGAVPPKSCLFGEPW